MAKEKMPRFVIYQSSQKEFHICFQVGDRYLRWCSYYPPALDTRYPREVTRIGDIDVKKLPRKPVFDEGSYTVTRSDGKAATEKKMAEGVHKKTFAFILDGKKLKGRFSLKNNGTRTVLQKYKDKYAVEEDVLSNDLARTIHTMLPDYDQDKIQLPHREKATKRPAPKKEKPVEEITADKKIGNTNYHFTFYTSDAGDVICLVTDVRGAAVVLQLTGKQWKLLPPAGRSGLKYQKEFAVHSKALFDKEGIS